MKKHNRWIALVLAIVMLLCITGCSKDPVQTDAPGNESKDDAPETPAPGTMVYQASFEELSMEYALNWISAYCVSGSTMYFGGNCTTGQEPYYDEVTGEPIVDTLTGEQIMIDTYEMVLFSLDLNTREFQVLENYQAAEIPEGLLGSTYLMSMTSGKDGSIWTMEEVYTYSYDLPEDFDFEDENAEYYEYYTPGENKYVFSNLDQTGQVIHSFEIAAEEGFYPSVFLTDSNGLLYVGAYDKKVILSADGSETLFTLADEDCYGELISLGKDKIGVIVYDYENGTRQFAPIDPVSMAMGETIDLPDTVARTYPGFGEYSFLFDNYSDTVYGYNEQTGESEKVFSWMDCDVSSDYVNQFSILEDGTVVALYRDYSVTEAAYELVELKLVDASTVPQKKELTMACMWLGSDLRAEIIKFNKTNPTTRIKVVDYSQYITSDDPNGGVTRLNTEILSGNVPDLLASDDLPIERYAAKGLLVDLWTLIDNDPELSRENLMSEFFDAISIDGHLYSVYETFSISTAVANGKYVGDRTSWTLEEMQQVLATLEPGASILSHYYTKADILSTCLNRSLSSFIDWEAMQCSFDSQQFIDILNFAINKLKTVSSLQKALSWAFICDCALWISKRKMGCAHVPAYVTSVRLCGRITL